MDDLEELDFIEVFAPRGSPEPPPSLPHLSMYASKIQPEVITIDSDDSAGPEDGRAPGKDEIWTLFPNICPDYVTQLLATHRNDICVIISAILDQQEADGKYPTQPDPRHLSRKRKRSSEGSRSGLDLDNGDGDDDGIEDHSGDEDGDPDYVNAVQSKIAKPDYAALRGSKRYTVLAKELLSQEFPKVPLIDIRNQLTLNNGSVFETYTAMDEQLRNADQTPAPWGEKKRASKIKHEFTPDQLPHLDMSMYKPDEQAALAEFSAARKLRAEKDGKIAAEAEERNNLARARTQNQIAECGICFEECAINRMVECQGEATHRFCRSCMRSQAEAQIGMAKHQLTCMSTDGCSAGFSMAQKALFLDKKLNTALDRIETEEVLRMAGIENLETCPFCPNAAEYPPVEVDKEFHCDNPSCLQVSCRLCRRPTHIPKTCAEDEADRGLDARHTLEEAMSEALIRRCNKCSYPFVKTEGCNKIVCVKCYTIQCDVCRKTISDYSHFDDEKRGGKRGQCPLFDKSDERHKEEVSNAETETRKKVLEKNPRVDENALRMETPGTTKEIGRVPLGAIRQNLSPWRRAHNRPRARVMQPRLPAIPPLAGRPMPLEPPKYEEYNMVRGPNHVDALNPLRGHDNPMLPMMPEPVGQEHPQPGNRVDGFVKVLENVRKRLGRPGPGLDLSEPVAPDMPLSLRLLEQRRKNGNHEVRGPNSCFLGAPHFGMGNAVEGYFQPNIPRPRIPPAGMPQPGAPQHGVPRPGTPSPPGLRAAPEVPVVAPNRLQLHGHNLFRAPVHGILQPRGFKGWPINDGSGFNEIR